jgi:hypothetical protein
LFAIPLRFSAISGVAGERSSQAEVQGVELRRQEENKNHEGTKPCFLFPNKS